MNWTFFWGMLIGGVAYSILDAFLEIGRKIFGNLNLKNRMWNWAIAIVLAVVVFEAIGFVAIRLGIPYIISYIFMGFGFGFAMSAMGHYEERQD